MLEAIVSVEGGMITIISALGVAVGALWKVVVKNNKEINRRLNDCEKDREELWKVILKGK